MRLKHLLVTFAMLWTALAVSAETLLLRKHPVRLQEGLVDLYQSGPVELDSTEYPHTARIEVGLSERDADTFPDTNETDKGAVLVS